jgi:hypothetical protein
MTCNDSRCENQKTPLFQAQQAISQGDSRALRDVISGLPKDESLRNRFVEDLRSSLAPNHIEVELKKSQLHIDGMKDDELHQFELSVHKQGAEMGIRFKIGVAETAPAECFDWVTNVKRSRDADAVLGDFYKDIDKSQPKLLNRDELKNGLNEAIKASRTSPRNDATVGRFLTDMKATLQHAFEVGDLKAVKELVSFANDARTDALRVASAKGEGNTPPFKIESNLGAREAFELRIRDRLRIEMRLFEISV